MKLCLGKITGNQATLAHQLARDFSARAADPKKTIPRSPFSLAHLSLQNQPTRPELDTLRLGLGPLPLQPALLYGKLVQALAETGADDHLEEALVVQHKSGEEGPLACKSASGDGVRGYFQCIGTIVPTDGDLTHVVLMQHRPIDAWVLFSHQDRKP